MTMTRWCYTVTQYAGFLLQILPVILLIYVPYDNSQLKIEKEKIARIMTIAAVIIFAFVSFLLGEIYMDKGKVYANIIENVAFVLYLTVATIVYFLNTRTDNLEKLPVYLFTAQYSAVSYSVAVLGVNQMREYFSFDSFPYSPAEVMIYILYLGITFPIVRHYLKKYNLKHLKRISKKNNYLISITSMVLFAIFIAALLMEMKARISGINHRYASGWILCLICSDITAYVIYFNCLSIENKNAEMQIQLTASDLQYKALCSKIQEEQRMRHNQRHHFRSLIGLLEAGEYDAMEQYLRTYLGEWERFSGSRISRNPVINHVLECYFTEAETRKIQVKHEIEVKEQYNFSISDMTVLLGNLMENALEACELCGKENPEIRLMIKQYKKSILIEETNTCVETSLKRTDTGISSSKKGRIEGYGISSIRMIAEKYRGNIEFWKEGNYFTIRIVMNIPEEAGKETEIKR